MLAQPMSWGAPVSGMQLIDRLFGIKAGKDAGLSAGDVGKTNDPSSSAPGSAGGGR